MKTAAGGVFALIGLGAIVFCLGIYERDRYFDWDELQLPVSVAVVFTGIGIGVIIEERRRKRKNSE